MGGYAPVIGQDEDEERRRNEDYYPPIDASGPRLIRRSGEPVDAAASSTPVVASGYAPVGGTDDLERHTSLAPYRGPDAIPAVGTPSEERLKKLTTSGAPPVEPLHGWKKGLDIAGQLFAPTRGLEKSLRYGPQTRYAENLKQAEGDVAAEQAPEAAKAKTQELQSRGEFEQAHAEAVRHPQPKVKTPEEQSFEGYLAKGMSPTDAFRAVKQDAQDVKPDPKQDDFEQYYAKYLQDNKFPDTAHNRLLAKQAYAAASQAPQRDPRQLAVGPDGTVIELKPGMKVPQGSKTVSGDLTHKPSADEQKRSDLVENLNENLDQLEDIVTRRPDLFGKVAGRITGAREWIGSNDPDIAALKGIEDRLGMVQQSSHGMRSAHHVEASAQSILNGFKNGPEAMKRAIADARKSGATFTADAERAKSATPAAPPKAGDVVDGYRFKGGDPGKQDNWEKAAQAK